MNSTATNTATVQQTSGLAESGGTRAMAPPIINHCSLENGQVDFLNPQLCGLDINSVSLGISSQHPPQLVM